MATLQAFGHGVAWGWRELGWWLTHVAKTVAKGLPFLGVALLMTSACLWFELPAWWLPLTVPALVGLAGLVWQRGWPSSFDRQVSQPRFRSRVRAHVRGQWPLLMESCGLARTVPKSASLVPELRTLRWIGGRLVAVPRLLPGQTVDDVADAGERLRVGVGATRLRVVADDARTGCRIEWLFGDPLAEPFTRQLPEDGSSSTVPPEFVALGRCEDGEPFRLPLRVPTLVVGATGAGKGSVMWGLMCELGPAVHAGTVQLYGIDLKGGMELGLGPEMLTRCAMTPEQAVALLEDAVAQCEARAASLAGRVRLHVPTVAEPLVVVVVDELASLVAYVSDRDLLRRGEAALSRLLSIGRAPGYCVWAFVQDPRKETLKMRHLFTQAVALRLSEREETRMVLGDGAIRAGAVCDQIGRSTPGVGYGVDETGRVVRMRASMVPDEVVRECATRFPARIQQPIVIPEVQDRRPRARSGRGT